MMEGSRFDRCRWVGCHASCVDEIELCHYHFRLIGETFIEKRSIWGATAMAQRSDQREQERAEMAAKQITREDWYRNRSVVYYVRLGDQLKIGYTIHLSARVSQLRVGPDALLAVEPGWRDQEALRHRQFADERQGRRENFNPSRRLLAHVDAVRSKYGDPWDYTKRRVKAAGPLTAVAS